MNETDWNEWMRDVCAFRYALGRRTYVVSMCADALAKSWNTLHPKAQQLIARDLREEIDRDEESRLQQSAYHPLGYDCDRDSWVRLMRTIEVNENQRLISASHPIQSPTKGQQNDNLPKHSQSIRRNHRGDG